MKTWFLWSWLMGIAWVLQAQTKGLPSAGNAPAMGQTYALIVGISDYAEVSDLSYADRDAQVFYEYLRSEAGGNVPEPNIIFLTNKMATSGQIIAGLSQLIDEVKTGDRVFFYFSGHGDVEKVTLNNIPFLLCHETRKNRYFNQAVNVRDLQAFLNTIAAKKAEVIVVTDACRAGELAGNKLEGNTGRQITSEMIRDMGKNITRLLSCQPEEVSLESKEWGGGRGLFSYHLVRGLQGFADANHDQKVTLNELENYLLAQVNQNAQPNAQTPVVESANKLRVLSHVHAPTLAALQQADKTTLQPLMAQIDNRGWIDDVLAKADSQAVKAYRSYEFFMQYEQYELAYSMFLMIEREKTLAPVVGYAKRNLIAGFLDHTNQLITKLYSGELGFFDIVGPYRPKLFSKEIFYYHQRVLELLGERHFLYKSLKPLDNWLWALHLYQKAGILKRDIEGKDSTNIEKKERYYHLVKTANTELDSLNNSDYPNKSLYFYTQAYVAQNIQLTPKIEKVELYLTEAIRHYPPFASIGYYQIANTYRHMNLGARYRIELKEKQSVVKLDREQVYESLLEAADSLYKKSYAFDSTFIPAFFATNVKDGFLILSWHTYQQLKHKNFTANLGFHEGFRGIQVELPREDTALCVKICQDILRSRPFEYLNAAYCESFLYLLQVYDAGIHSFSIEVEASLYNKVGHLDRCDSYIAHIDGVEDKYLTKMGKRPNPSPTILHNNRIDSLVKSYSWGGGDRHSVSFFLNAVDSLIKKSKYEHTLNSEWRDSVIVAWHLREYLWTDAEFSIPSELYRILIQSKDTANVINAFSEETNFVNKQLLQFLKAYVKSNQNFWVNYHISQNNIDKDSAGYYLEKAYEDLKSSFPKNDMENMAALKIAFHFKDTTLIPIQLKRDIAYYIVQLNAYPKSESAIHTLVEYLLKNKNKLTDKYFRWPMEQYAQLFWKSKQILEALVCYGLQEESFTREVIHHQLFGHRNYTIKSASEQIDILMYQELKNYSYIVKEAEEIGYLSKLDSSYAKYYYDDAVRAAYSYLRLGDTKNSLKYFKKIQEKFPQEPWSSYNLACFYAITKNKKEALNWLEKALQKGFDNHEHIKTDTDLDNIRALPQFKALLQKYFSEKKD